MSELKRILIVCPSLDMPGGVANYYKALKKYFPANVEYFTVGKRPGESNILKTIGRLVNDMLSFKRTVKQSKFDVIVVNPSLDKKALTRDRRFVTAARGAGAKVVTFFRGWSETLAETLSADNILIKDFLLSDAIITLSEDSKNVLKKLGYTKNIFVETTTVDDDLLTYDVPVKAAPGAGGSLNILLLSRVERSKGAMEAIDTFKILRSKYTQLHMTIAGNGSLLEEAKSTVTAQGLTDGITFPGYVTGAKKAASYADADVYFFPSYHNEGMPNSVLEAMAFGLPVVSRDVGGLVDFFENGQMGFLTETRDPKVFAQLLDELLGNPEKMKTIGSYNRVYAKYFLASAVTARLMAIFNAA